MAPVLSKEAVLCGSVDQLCLACESYLRSEREALRHVGTAGHRARWARTRYLQHYEQHRVRKVNKWYLCEFCNVLLTTRTKVRLHVEELTHKEYMQVIERVDDVIIARGVEIKEEAWQGFINDSTCVVCNLEFENKDVHMKESNHLINLIQSKISYDGDDIYRKIKDSTFHCLTCNELLVKVTAHFGSIKHKELVRKYTNDVVHLNHSTEIETETAVEECAALSMNKVSHKVIGYDIPSEILKCNNLSGGMEEKSNKKDEPDLNESNDKKKSDLIDHNITAFQKDVINADVDSSSNVSEYCLIIPEFHRKITKRIEERINTPSECSEATPIILETDQITKTSSLEARSHEHEATKEKLELTIKISRNQKEKDHEDNAVKKMAEEHGLTYVSKENKVHCQTCNEVVPSSVKKLKKHVNGQLHTSKLKLQSGPTNSEDGENRKKRITKACKLQRLPSNQFVKKIALIKTHLDDFVVVNDKYCINVLSFTFLSVLNRKKARCQLCETNLLVKDMKEHVNVAKHCKAAAEVPLILHADSEFIREVGSGKFHCGFCNTVESWDDMGNHLNTIQHKESKIFADWRLLMFLPEITQSLVDRQTYNDFLITIQLLNII